MRILPRFKMPAYDAPGSFFSGLPRMEIDRSNEFGIVILHCGVGHSDLHLEVLNFCAEHRIASDIEVILIRGINATYDRFRYMDSSPDDQASSGDQADETNRLGTL